MNLYSALFLIAIIRHGGFIHASYCCICFSPCFINGQNLIRSWWYWVQWLSFSYPYRIWNSSVIICWHLFSESCLPYRNYPPPSERKIWVLIVCACFIAARNFSPSPLFVDSLICVVMVQLYRVISISNPLKHALAFLGKHSMNIFLFHTFIYYFWFREYIYFTRMPIIIYLILLIVCIVISVMLEWVKKYTIYRFL